MNDKHNNHENPIITERRRRDDSIEIKLSDIREQLKASTERMNGVDNNLVDLKQTNATIREYSEAIFEFIRVVSRVQKFALWLAAFAGAVVTMWMLGEKAGWW